MIFKKKYTGQQLLGDIRSAASEANNRAFAFLYRQYLEPFRQFVRNHGGGAEEAKDVFQEGIIVFYKKIKAGEEIGYPTTFFFSVCKHLWLDRAHQRANRDRIARELPAELTSDDLEAALEAERDAALMGLLGTLGESCREMLLGFYYEKKSMQELAGEMGYASEAVAKNKKAAAAPNPPFRLRTYHAARTPVLTVGPSSCWRRVAGPSKEWEVDTAD